ncbi:uncharacterized protein LOC128681518 isoform X2 [Plodia interpunctella]|nr:uncharacterized protein LOC128681518 isoform X2 [Plodia interpunctella]
MQQQITEQNQAGCQPGQQQMVLCPVRVVYETQMLVQPGEQLQPNQTIFINPQNTPPWVQNRQMQNQVIYVQSVPNNYMPSVQPQMDPNQLYFQQSYQQIVQQPMIHQGHDMRQYQVNMMPNNIAQNAQNIVPNMPNQVVQQTIQQNERVNEPNYIQIQQNVAPNTPITSVNSPQIVKQHNVNVQTIQNQQIVNQRQVYLNHSQQNNQQVNMTRPQLITVNPMQQVNVQTFDKTQNSNAPANTQVMAPMYHNTVASRQIVNTMVQTEPRMRKTNPNVTQIATNVRNVAPSYMYRPIQPRPQYRANLANMSVQNTMTNVQNTTPQIPNLMHIQAAPQNTNHEVRKTNEETRGRKRKSESPDELSKKVAIVNTNTAFTLNPVRIPQAPVLNPVKSVEIGVNTSPVHRPKAPITTHVASDSKVTISISKINNNDSVKVNETVRKTDNIATDKDKEIKAILETNAADKVRYTVFPQARVRPPKDEFNIVNVNILKDTKNILYSDEKNEIKLESKNLLKEKILSRTEVKKEIEDKSEISVGLNNEELKKEEMKTEGVKDKKDLKDYVLTHVLDGIVIQESNTAFPIREPTKTNASPEMKRDIVKVDSMLKGNCLELPISDLKLKEEDRLKEEKDNPFIDLKTATIKSWTVDDLCSHLTKYKWDDTISLLQEHEIDGESLLLVSKPQLLHIGVKEKFADIICEFVKS